MNALNFGDELVDRRTNAVVMQVTKSTLLTGKVCVLEAGAEVERWYSFEDVRAQIANGRWEVRRPGSPRIAAFPDRNDSTTCKHKVRRGSAPGHAEDIYLDANARAVAVARRFNEYCNRHKVCVRVAYAEIRAEFERERPDLAFPSVSTVYRFLERYRCHSPLVRPNYLKGNRTKRYPSGVYDLICNVASDTFLQEGSKWTLKELTDKCRRDAIARGLLTPSSPLSMKFVRRVIVKRLHAMPEVTRLLAKDRPSKTSIATNRIRVDGIFQRVEQDAVHLPFVVTTPDGVSSDVWLIHAIDCATGNVVGWHLKIGTPNESDGLRCIESIIYSKKPAFERLGIKGADDIYGLPSLLLLDNGAEAKGERFRRLTQIGIDVAYCKSRHPHEKPFIERLNKSLKVALQLLPGCTRMDGRDGQRDPVALGDDLMDLHELERWVVDFYYVAWAEKPLTRFVDEDVFGPCKQGTSPKERFEKVRDEKQPMPLSPNLSDWIRVKHHVVSRTLSIKSGITIEGFEFRGDNLKDLIAQCGEGRVDVLYDPEDFRRVYVLNDKELVELQNQAASDITPAYSFAQAKIQKAAAVSQQAETPRTAAFIEALYNRSMLTGRACDTPRKSPGRAAKKAVVARTQHRDAVERAARLPLTPPKSKTSSLADSVSIPWDDVDELSTRDRTTGAAL
jgi:putative transposase